MQIKYTTSVLVAAGWRSIEIVAECEPISPKRVKNQSSDPKRATITKVISIDGDNPNAKHASRTGANRQSYNPSYIAQREIGKVKILSRCDVFLA